MTRANASLHQQQTDQLSTCSYDLHSSTYVILYGSLYFKVKSHFKKLTDFMIGILWSIVCQLPNLNLIKEEETSITWILSSVQMITIQRPTFLQLHQ